MTPHRIDQVDYPAIGDDVVPDGRLNITDLQTAIELCTQAHAMLPTDRGFWRAANSLQPEEMIGRYVARVAGEEKHLAMIDNRHPLIPFSTPGAGFRLVLYRFLRESEAKAAERPRPVPRPPQIDASQAMEGLQ